MVKKEFYSFKKAREYVHTLNLKGIKEYFQYTKSKDFPDFLPKRPENTYKDKGWDGATDWVGGTHKQYSTGGDLLPFEKAREYVQELKLKTQKEWYEYAKSDKKPANIPSGPWTAYKNQWISTADWLGAKRIKGAKARNFDDARKFARELQFSSRKQWTEFAKSDELPFDIPRHPEETYRGKFQGFPDWLNYKIIDKFLSFDDARELLIQMGITSSTKFLQLSKSGKRPSNIPSNPVDGYREEWKGWAHFCNNAAVGKTGTKKEFLSFDDAQKFVCTLNLKGSREWREYAKSGKKPANIPSNPEISYKEEWAGYSYWVGTTNSKKIRENKYLKFQEARQYVRALKLSSIKEWIEFTKSGKVPKDIPANPQVMYDDWTGYADWLGVTLQKGIKSNFISFQEARQYVRALKLSSIKEWIEFTKSGKKPANIPSGPDRVYRGEWKGHSDWLGHSNSKYGNRSFRPFIEAREYVRELKLKGQKEWLRWTQSGKRPIDIPSTPHNTYKKEYVDLADWLGTTRRRSTSFLSFEESREYARGLNISSIFEWDTLCKEQKIPQNIPKKPEITFSMEWITWYDWLGHDDPNWSTIKVKELLRDLIKSGSIWNFEEADLLILLDDVEVLNTFGRHRDFFQNLIQASRTSEGRKLIEEYAKSDSTNPPDLSGIVTNTDDPDADIETVQDDQLLKNDDKDPINKNSTQSVKEVLLQSRILKLFENDEQKIKYHKHKRINTLWKLAFDDENKTVAEVRDDMSSENFWEKSVADEFLNEYEKTIDLPMPKGYILQDPITQNLVTPFLMQRYVAYKIKTQDHFGNFSGPGAGKTLSALIASRTINSKLTLIVCPNDVVQGWRDYIKNSLSNSEIISGNEVFDVKNADKFQYLVLNYDKLNQNNSENNVLKLIQQKIDFVVLDEIHWAKNTSTKNMNKRRKNLELLLLNARKINPKIKILGLSATPVVNNLQEGKSLLQLMTGYDEDHLKTRSTTKNAVKLYQELSSKSIRQIPNYKKPQDNRVDVNLEYLTDAQKQFLTNKPMAMEQILTDVRLPEIIKRIDGQTIIYTEYLGTSDPNKTKIIDKIKSAVKLAGFSYGLYIGEDRSGLNKFKEKEIQVLIASRPISTGIDGLQRVCNNLIFNTLPWTNAQYIQIIGRLVRTGQEKEVKIHHILAGIKKYRYDHLKMGRINFKRTLADCAVDGILPEANLVTPAQANREAIKWLNRLDN